MQNQKEPQFRLPTPVTGRPPRSSKLTELLKRNSSKTDILMRIHKERVDLGSTTSDSPHHFGGAEHPPWGFPER